ncbi:MAG: hypothetical protein Q9220_000388 [cf. Caloplaca sp. 1 TL-2023]
MAEAAGLALAVFSALDGAIQCFDFVHLGRNFDRDSQSVILKLDIAKLKLSRWGCSVGFDAIDSGALKLRIAATSEELSQANKLLEHIQYLFHQANQVSADLEHGHTIDAINTGDDIQSLHKHLDKLCLKNFHPKKMLQKAKWATYSEKHVRRLFEDVTEQVDCLIDLFPAAQPAQKQLCVEEGKDLASNEHMGLLEPIVAEHDPMLNEMIKESKQAASSTYHTSFNNSTNYGSQQGSNSGTQTFNFGNRQKAESQGE